VQRPQGGDGILHDRCAVVFLGPGHGGFPYDNSTLPP
jgi:hypothetical protein